MIDFRKSDFDMWWDIWGSVEGNHQENRNIAWRAWQAAHIEYIQINGFLPEDYPNSPRLEND